MPIELFQFQQDAASQMADRYIAYGDANRCPCLAYTGPEPLHTYIPTEIAGE